MKKINFILTFICFGIYLNAQNAFRIKVIDAETRDGIEKALVFIEEIPVPDQETVRWFALAAHISPKLKVVDFE